MVRVFFRPAGDVPAGTDDSPSGLVFVIGDEIYPFEEEESPGIVFVTGTEPETELSFSESGSDMETGAADESFMPQVESVMESGLELESMSELTYESGVHSPADLESNASPSPVPVNSGQVSEPLVVAADSSAYQEAVLARLDSLVFCGTYLFGMLLFLVVVILIWSCNRIIRLFI